MSDTIDLVPEDEDAVEVTVRLPRAAALAAERHDLLPLARLLADAASPARAHARLLLVEAVSALETSLPRRIPLPPLALPRLRPPVSYRAEACAVTDLAYESLARIEGQVYALVPIEEPEEPVDWDAMEAEADRQKAAGMTSGPVSGEDFLSMIAGESGRTLEELLTDAGMSRGDI
ncbi:hypothetical protein [Streptomyces sp. NBC_01264]|uniref:hypothetical protein n=1 Tax=Streptomyces sp. NBC_01264 TaxID=2903804 RepID=UPI0022501A6F|nr:hypothetical protein [Streptomyces sp. NBC_01264]MCX4783328.1 hypothetical protein [Streptomyces sp. NBC_01264]